MKKILLILLICLPVFVFAAAKTDLNKVKRVTEQGLYTKCIQQIITDYSVQKILIKI